MYNILIVDDEPTNIKLVAGILSKIKDYKLSFATGGQKALMMLNDKNYDLVLLDIMMPDIDGFKVFEKMNKTPLLKDIPVIFLTAKTDPASIAKALGMGAADYIIKPINAIELISRVKSFILINEQKKEIQELKLQIEYKNYFIKEALSLEKDPMIVMTDHSIIAANSSFLELFKCSDIGFLQRKYKKVYNMFDSNDRAKEVKSDKEWLLVLLRATKCIVSQNSLLYNVEAKKVCTKEHTEYIVILYKR